MSKESKVKDAPVTPEEPSKTVFVPPPSTTAPTTPPDTPVGSPVAPAPPEGPAPVSTPSSSPGNSGTLPLEHAKLVKGTKDTVKDFLAHLADDTIWNIRREEINPTTAPHSWKIGEAVGATAEIAFAAWRNANRPVEEGVYRVLPKFMTQRFEVSNTVSQSTDTLDPT